MHMLTFATLSASLALLSLVEGAPLVGLLRKRDPETNVNRCRPEAQDRCTLTVRSSLLGKIQLLKFCCRVPLTRYLLQPFPRALEILPMD